jgi:hypothetical protein
MNTRFLTLVTLVFVLLAGCSPAATPTPPPPLPTATATPAPTSTPTPLPTATPTATPNATATQAARATAQAEEQSAQVKSELEALGIPVDTGSLGFYQAQPQEIVLTEYQQWTYDPLAGDFGAGDFVISTDVTWDTDAIMTCGFFFRSEDNFEQGAQYLFQFLRLSGLPAWEIAYLKDGKYENSVAGAASSAIDQESGATNKIVLAVEGEKFTLYINDERQGSYYDYSKQRLDGKFAFSAWQDSGETTCTFENTAVWVYK